MLPAVFRVVDVVWARRLSGLLLVGIFLVIVLRVFVREEDLFFNSRVGKVLGLLRGLVVRVVIRVLWWGLVVRVVPLGVVIVWL